MPTHHDHRKSFVLATATGPPPTDLPARLARKELVQDTSIAVVPTAMIAHNPATNDSVVLLHAPNGFPAKVERTISKVKRCLDTDWSSTSSRADIAVRQRAADWLRAEFESADDLRRHLETTEALDAFWQRAVEDSWGALPPTSPPEFRIGAVRVTACKVHGLVFACGPDCRSLPRPTPSEQWYEQFRSMAAARGCTQLQVVGPDGVRVSTLWGDSADTPNTERAMWTSTEIIHCNDNDHDDDPDSNSDPDADRRLRDYLLRTYGTDDLVHADRLHRDKLDLRLHYRRAQARAAFAATVAAQVQSDPFLDLPEIGKITPTEDERQEAQKLGPFAHPTLNAWARGWLMRCRQARPTNAALAALLAQFVDGIANERSSHNDEQHPEAALVDAVTVPDGLPGSVSDERGRSEAGDHDEQHPEAALVGDNDMDVAIATYGAADVPLMANAQAYHNVRAHAFLRLNQRRLERGDEPLTAQDIYNDALYRWQVAPTAFLGVDADTGSRQPCRDQDEVVERLCEWLRFFGVQPTDLTQLDTRRPPTLPPTMPDAPRAEGNTAHAEAHAPLTIPGAPQAEASTSQAEASTSQAEAIIAQADARTAQAEASTAQAEARATELRRLHESDPHGLTQSELYGYDAFDLDCWDEAFQKSTSAANADLAAAAAAAAAADQSRCPYNGIAEAGPASAKRCRLDQEASSDVLAARAARDAAAKEAALERERLDKLREALRRLDKVAPPIRDQCTCTFTVLYGRALLKPARKTFLRPPPHPREAEAAVQTLKAQVAKALAVLVPAPDVHQ